MKYVSRMKHISRVFLPKSSGGACCICLKRAVPPTRFGIFFYLDVRSEFATESLLKFSMESIEFVHRMSFKSSLGEWARGYAGGEVSAQGFGVAWWVTCLRGCDGKFMRRGQQDAALLGGSDWMAALAVTSSRSKIKPQQSTIVIQTE